MTVETEMVTAVYRKLVSEMLGKVIDAAKEAYRSKENCKL